MGGLSGQKISGSIISAARVRKKTQEKRRRREGEGGREGGEQETGDRRWMEF
jgi:hypothetical protein